uniref:Uncharacterized protein n=1 Tax=Candidatus Kentrum sp. FM TaxID=2126340 RepID=A0A450RWD2_9GAMM|nr:MAG: hypothetical protein BECKFM1743A_GA0114220_1000823 [Candidatus Kentron sp. FM]VFJ43881.1 MAG: hypothetical protein BECKFM1743C_GA0114222_1000425 [Candidatus Kentron sp. FM]VFK05748.1 MAG: hypothetical protein BECKFM1743B_GA0114221_100046 [Candidatus Kentron sp. FM]
MLGAIAGDIIGSVYELEQFNDDMVLRDQPAADLEDIYFLEAIPYHKSDVVQVIKIAVFVPEENLDQVKSAMFQAGAGKIGNYDCCCFETRGVGQFRPLQGTNPHIGESGGGVKTVEEVKVEIVCADDLIVQVVDAMKIAHPYETPAYDLFKMLDY